MVLCQLAVSNVQYAWTLFADPIQAKFHWSQAAIQTTFSILVITQSFLMPLVGHGADRLSPRTLMAIGGGLFGIAWLVNGSASSLPALYLGGVLGGLAYAIVQGVAVGHALKWFPDQRGLAVGLTSGAFAAGAMLTVLPMTHMIESLGYQATFLRFGALLGAIILAAATVLKAPNLDKAARAHSPAAHGGQASTPRQALTSPVFYLLYALLTLTCTGGLFVAAQLGAMARDFRLASAPMTWCEIGAAALPLALIVSRLFDGLGRPLFGWVSDHLGRRTTLFVAFLLEAASLAAFPLVGRSPGLFVLLAGLVALAFGQAFCVFPALLGDLFGPPFVATIWGLLWTSKGVASLLVPAGSWLVASTGGWEAPLAGAACLNLVAAALVLTVLKPVCARAPSDRGTAGVPAVVIVGK